MKIRYSSYRGCGKDFANYIKLIKRICFKYYGFRFYFLSPKERMKCIEHIDHVLNYYYEVTNNESTM